MRPGTTREFPFAKKTSESNGRTGRNALAMIPDVQKLHACSPGGLQILAHFPSPTLFRGQRQNAKDGSLRSGLPWHPQVNNLSRARRANRPVGRNGDAQLVPNGRKTDQKPGSFRAELVRSAAGGS
jgi:hypothetical protein